MKTLKTERLVFRPYIKCEEDRAAVAELLTDSEVMKRAGESVMTKEEAEESFNRIFTRVYEMSAFDIWSVFLREDSRYIGHAEIKPRRKGAHDWEIIYILKREHWGHGYATEIAEALIKYGFQDRKLKRVVAIVDNEDRDSIRVLENAGMRLDAKELNEQDESLVYAISSI
jgi:RimJ/RimL family protein N-acetyltransferase